MREYIDLESDVDRMYQETVDWIRDSHARITFQNNPCMIKPELIYISDEFSCVPTSDIGRPLRDEEFDNSNVVTALLHNSSTKPLLYSVDVYRSMKDGEYVAVCSYPIKDNTKTGKMIKPYALGKTTQEAEEKLANSIRGFSGRKELGIINVRYELKRWFCVHCSNGSTYETKQLLMEHLSHRHNTGVEKYTNPTNVDTFLMLPLKAGI